MALSPRFRLKVFQTAVIAVIVSFFCLLAVVVIAAKSVQSGRTNIDVAKMPDMRDETVVEKGTVTEARKVRMMAAKKAKEQNLTSSVP